MTGVLGKDFHHSVDAQELGQREPGLLDVVFEEEVREKHKVAGVDEKRRVQALHLDLASRLGDFRIRAGQYLVQRCDNETAEQHLPDLQDCDRNGHPPGQVQVQSTQRIVEVHEGMYYVVHVSEPSTNCQFFFQTFYLLQKNQAAPS